VWWPDFNTSGPGAPNSKNTPAESWRDVRPLALWRKNSSFDYQGLLHGEVFSLAIGTHIDRHNESPKPFIWTARAADILEKVKRPRRTLNKRQSTQEQRQLIDREGQREFIENYISRLFDAIEIS
jgi:hypothetical protein